MSLLNSKFDIVSVDNPVSLASLAQVLPTAAATFSPEGTPVPGTFSPGAIVTMTSGGVAQLGTATAAPQLVFVTVDGDTDYSGSFVRKLTVLHGGVSIKTDQYKALDGSAVAIAYAPGAPLSFNAGKLVTLANAVASGPAGLAISNAQPVGFVGPEGLKDGVLHAILPQGAGV